MSDRIYLAIDGKKAGPFNEQEVRRMLTEGTATSNTLAWEKGLPQWIPLAQFLVMLTVTPASTATVSVNAESTPLTVTRHKGINRSVFCIILLIILTILFFHTALPKEIVGVTLPVLIIATILRLINVGYANHRLGIGVLLSLLMCIPLVNLCSFAVCIFCQPGYAKTKELDKTGQFLFTIFIIIAAVYVICGIWFFSTWLPRT